MSVPWFKHAVLYSINVESFLDTNGDGIGDFRGVIESLGYLNDLGVTCVWLLPFYPSPRVDDGYDIADYFSIDPRFGTIEDFDELIDKAGKLGIRIIIDLVVNHTSDKHWWFLESRRKKTSKFHDFYIWSVKKPKKRFNVGFKGEQQHVWTLDEIAGEYYLHRFYKEEPDLNIVNPEVQDEIKRIIEFWIRRGISGFRIDVAHILIDLEAPSETKGKDFNILNLIHNAAYEKDEVMLLAEANDISSRLSEYFGKGDRMNVLFNFILNQHMFLALARESADPVIEELHGLPQQPETGQWLNFLRNHDELTLDKLSEEEQNDVYNAFAPDNEMRIFGRGIRRRLAPMLSNDRRKMELAYSMIFSFPGMPMIRYGDEIGMGEDLSLKGRQSFRTVMQWSGEKNGGFSTADSRCLIMPVISGGTYGYEKINVATQYDNEHSFLNFIRKLIRLRKECIEIGEGVFSIIDHDETGILIHRIQGKENTFIAIHNLAGRSVKISRDKYADETKIILYDNNESDLYFVSPYGYRWLLFKNDDYEK